MWSRDLPIHIDLMRLKRTSRVNLFIPVEFINGDTCPGIKKGGVLTVVRNEVEMDVLAGDTPRSPDRRSGQSPRVGDVIHISDVTLPEGAKPVIDRNFVIANISAPRGLLASTDDDEATDAA